MNESKRILRIISVVLLVLILLALIVGVMIFGYNT